MVLELNTYLIDFAADAWSEEGEPLGIEVVRFSVLAKSAEDALRRFLEEEAGVEVDRTPPQDLIVLGITSG